MKDPRMQFFSHFAKAHVWKRNKMRKEVLPAKDCATLLKCHVMIGVGQKESYFSVCVLPELNYDGVFCRWARDWRYSQQSCCIISTKGCIIICCVKFN